MVNSAFSPLPCDAQASVGLPQQDARGLLTRGASVKHEDEDEDAEELRRQFKRDLTQELKQELMQNLSKGEAGG